MWTCLEELIQKEVGIIYQNEEHQHEGQSYIVESAKEVPTEVPTEKASPDEQE
jgi:hypothetical protein